MKKLLFTIVLSYITSMQCLAQVADTSSATQTDLFCFYLHKSQAENTMGWFFLIPGAAMMTLEGAGYSDGFLKYGFHSRRAGLFVVGTAMALRGIPFFISAGKYRKRAYLSLQRKNVLIRERYASENCFYAAIFLKIRF